MYILMLGCFDTKGEEFSSLYSSIIANGEKVITVNTGVMNRNELFPVNFDAEKVAAEGGVSLHSLRIKQDRGHAVDVMSKGAVKIIRKLISERLIKGAIGMGGGAGTFITLSAMQEIPLGIPKFCLSTLAGKDVTRLVGNKDITLMPSIVDVAGLNRISRPLIRQAAAAICAMANAKDHQENSSKGSIAVSMFGNTTQCVNKCTELLKKRGYEVLAFHANGVGGKTMESLIREGCFDAVLDITTTELADDLFEGICSAGPTRLSAASEMGIPQVVVPGCLDMVNFGHPDTIPDRFKSRKFYSWAPDVTLMRTNEEENKILGKLLAQRLNLSTAPVSVLLPIKGISQIDSEGGIFFRPDTNRILFQTIKDNISDKIKVAELNLHINDEEFAEELVKVLLNIIEGEQASKMN
jgi:uncharacterized protein (UPF0261 family)